MRERVVAPVAVMVEPVVAQMVVLAEALAEALVAVLAEALVAVPVAVLAEVLVAAQAVAQARQPLPW